MSASFSRLLCHCDLLLRCNCPLCCVVVVPNSAHILKVSSSSRAMFHTVWGRGQAAGPSWGGWYLRAPILWCGDECVFLYLVSFEAASAHTRLRLAAHLSLNNIKASPIYRICWIVKGRLQIFSTMHKKMQISLKLYSVSINKLPLKQILWNGTIMLSVWLLFSIQKCFWTFKLCTIHHLVQFLWWSWRYMTKVQEKSVRVTENCTVSK